MLKIIFWTLITAIGWLIIRCSIKYIINQKYQYDEYIKALTENNSDAYRIATQDPWHHPRKEYIPFNELPSLPIEQFIRFYSVDPSKWQLAKGCAYRTDDYSAAIFFQPFNNYLRYERFRKTTKKEHKKIAQKEVERGNKVKQDENLEALLALVQKDIDNAFEESKKEFEKAVEITEKIATNMNKQNISS